MEGIYVGRKLQEAELMAAVISPNTAVAKAVSICTDALNAP